MSMFPDNVVSNARYYLTSKNTKQTLRDADTLDIAQDLVQ